MVSKAVVSDSSRNDLKKIDVDSMAPSHARWPYRPPHPGRPI